VRKFFFTSPPPLKSGFRSGFWIGKAVVQSAHAISSMAACELPVDNSRFLWITRFFRVKICFIGGKGVAIGKKIV